MAIDLKLAQKRYEESEASAKVAREMLEYRSGLDRERTETERMKLKHAAETSQFRQREEEVKKESIAKQKIAHLGTRKFPFRKSEPHPSDHTEQSFYLK